MAIQHVPKAGETTFEGRVNSDDTSDPSDTLNAFKSMDLMQEHFLTFFHKMGSYEHASSDSAKACKFR